MMTMVMDINKWSQIVHSALSVSYSFARGQYLCVYRLSTTVSRFTAIWISVHFGQKLNGIILQLLHNYYESFLTIDLTFSQFLSKYCYETNTLTKKQMPPKQYCAFNFCSMLQ